MLVDIEDEADFEIVFGFVAPIGTDLDRLLMRLTEELRIYKYSSHTIRLSHLLDTKSVSTDTAGYYKSRMDMGDAFRKEIGSGDALAALGIVRIIEKRGDEERSRRHAWLVRTLKHEDEALLFRQTYGDRFILIGVHQDIETRTENLSATLREESVSTKDLKASIAGLIERDNADLENDFGQHGSDVYALADIFIDLNQPVESEVARLLGLMFGDPFITPTRDEVGMFHAYGASLRSSDAGRQVGAAITLKTGEVVATGANEVPRAGGGEYWNGDEGDSRDFRVGSDYNKKQTRRVLKELLSSFATDHILAADLNQLSPDELIEKVLDRSSGGLKDTRLMSLIEFGRVVHAEMSALSQASRLGVPTRGAVLYTTAFPCHMCMRLIISSGISKVIYLDPYPKSLALEMYSDSITSVRPVVGTKSVELKPFCGVSWNTYPRIFSKINRNRDKHGTFLSLDKAKARMRLPRSEPLLNADLLELQIPVALSVVRDRNILEKQENGARHDEPPAK